MPTFRDHALRQQKAARIRRTAFSLKPMEAPDRRIACLPPSPTIDQYRDAFLAFVAAHPEAASQRALQTVKAALAAHWPCP